LSASKLTSIRPYLIRAFYDWILDNQLTPHLLVDATVNGVIVPPRYVKDGKIVLNVAPSAVRALKMDNDLVAFSARFGGAPFDISVPVRAVEAIYSRENGKGMVFPPDEEVGPDDNLDPPPAEPPKRPTLKIVK
jgi:stringent starvation protein B